MIALTSAALFLSPLVSEQDRFNEVYYPPMLRVCLSNEVLDANVRVNGWRNPAYLRGDFNADGEIDFAVEVTVRESFSEAILICHGGGGFAVIASDATGIDTMPVRSLGENFFLPWNRWRVLSESEVDEFLSDAELYDEIVVPPIDDHSGEALLFSYEISRIVLYWTGEDYAYSLIGISN